MRLVAGGILFLAAASAVFAQGGGPAVEYEAAFDNAVHHEARISVTYRAVGTTPLEFRMARSSPGRYAIHEFAKNVYDVGAVDGAGRRLKILRSDPYSWHIGGHDGTVRVSYTLFANRADGTYSQVDETHAHLNMPATFMWARGFDDRPIRVRFRTAGRPWKAATQLKPTGEPMSFEAPGLQYFLDSPTELSDFDLREWSVGDQTIRLAVHHNGAEADVDVFVERAKKIVAEQIKVFGGAPKFDFGVYTFIADYLPHVSSDGMEHRNSTILSGTQGLYEADFRQIGTLSHEFFHSWNVERIRPAEIEPFDFTKADFTPSLWFAEGFTSYYGALLVRRAQESSVREYIGSLGGLLNSVVLAPGRRFGSPQEMSLRAPFVDAAAAIDPTSFANTFVSYYSYGQTLALALDLTLRNKFKGVTLDDYMKHIWETHGRTEKPYTPEDLEQGLAAVTSDPGFARDFFSRYIEESDLPDFGPLLEPAGLRVRPRISGKASLGRVAWSRDGGGVAIQGATLIGEPLYKAGLDGGDLIVSIGRFKIDTTQDIASALGRLKPSDEVAVRFRRHGEDRSAQVVLAEDKAMEVVRFEDASEKPSDAQLAFRERWLGPDGTKARGKEN